MAHRNIFREIGLDDLEAEVAAAFGSHSVDDLTDLYSKPGQAYEVGQIVEGKITKITGDEVFVDIGYKCEGSVSLKEWDPDESPTIGEKIEVLLEAVEEEGGVLTLSSARQHVFAAGKG